MPSLERRNGWPSDCDDEFASVKAMIQRVTRAKVTVHQQIVGEIDAGLLVLLGVDAGDTESVANRLASKVVNYRVFADDAGHMNQSVQDIGGELLVVSQFTLSASTKKGLRPSFSSAKSPDLAETLYEYFVARVGEVVGVKTGRFGADMQIELVNDGPVTFLLEVME